MDTGVPLVAVFDIINQDKRLQVENPVTRTLRAVGTVGLTNNMLLISRDGTPE